MKKDILQKIKDWRVKTARRESVELFRVISHQAVEEIAREMPQSKEELLKIKGIKEKKYAKYGEEILGIVRGEGEKFIESFREEKKVFEVGEYLNYLNEKLMNLEARVKGEVSSVDVRGNYIFFGIKDKTGEGLINCFIWAKDFEVSGVRLEAGMEVVVWGFPNIYKPSGRFSFQTKLIELVGEGLLKKAYEELKRKLENEGLFAPERKKTLPRFIQKIGLITSHQGAAIGDFVSNIGNFGYKIKFYDSRVEGKQAVFDLVKGVKWFNRHKPDIDVIVLVRGGGILESLAAFNTEALVREITSSKIPVLAGIGHEQDVTLAAMAADFAVSTPTAAAQEIRRDWDEAVFRIERVEKIFLNSFEGAVSLQKNIIRESEYILSQKLSEIFERFRRAKGNLRSSLVKIKSTINYNKKYLSHTGRRLSSGFIRQFSESVFSLKNLAEKIALYNPERQLKLGYSLVSMDGKIVRSVKDVNIGDEVDVKVSDGEFTSEVKKI